MKTKSILTKNTSKFKTFQTLKFGLCLNSMWDCNEYLRFPLYGQRWQANCGSW